jgi:hypothetical protein
MNLFSRQNAMNTRMNKNFIASETRQIIAHSLSCGKGVEHFASPGWGERTGAFLRRFFLPPLTGLEFNLCFQPHGCHRGLLSFATWRLGDSEKVINFNVPILNNGNESVV